MSSLWYACENFACLFGVSYSTIDPLTGRRLSPAPEAAVSVRSSAGITGAHEHSSMRMGTTERPQKDAALRRWAIVPKLDAWSVLKASLPLSKRRPTRCLTNTGGPDHPHQARLRTYTTACNSYPVSAPCTAPVRCPTTDLTYPTTTQAQLQTKCEPSHPAPDLNIPKQSPPPFIPS